MQNEFDIIENLVKTLGSIKQGVQVNDFLGAPYVYNFTPGIVSSDFQLWTTVKAFPAYFVNSGDTGYEWFPSRRVKSTANISITIYVYHTHDVEKMLHRAVQDVIVAMMQDVTRGGVATATFPQICAKETRRYVPYGLAEIKSVVLYHTGA